ncbi:MAG: HTH domain-containing protein [Methylococcales bacterium]
MNKISQRQHEILEHFLAHKQGLSIDELTESLGISRTAVQQHFIALENDGYIEKNAFDKTAGRPLARYAITDKGINHFPKHYAFLADLMLENLLETISSEDGEIYMTKLGGKLAGQLHQFAGKSTCERVLMLVETMNDLGFVVQETENPEGKKCLQACNCIYHDLVQKYPQICQFDLALMKTTLGESVELTRNMAKGDSVCEFLISHYE